MNKKFSALAVGAALAAPIAAQADVTVVGRAQMELENTKIETPAASSTLRRLVDNNMGRLGVNAAEDLGDGLTGLAHYGFDLPTGGAAGSIAARQSYVGIAGGFGALRFGRLAGVYKDTNLDPYIETALEARALGGESAGNFGHNGFINDVIKYDATFGGLQIAALVTAGNQTNGDSGDYQLAGDYKNGGLRLILAYSKDKDATGPNTPAEKRTKLAVQYKLGSGNLTAQIEKVKNYSSVDVPSLGLVGDVGDTDFYLLSYNFHFGDVNSLYVRYGREKYKDAPGYANGLKVSSYAVALQHKMSRTFRVWMGYFESRTKPTARKLSNFSIGMRKDF